MSATLDAAAWARYFDAPPSALLALPPAGRHCVRELFLGDLVTGAWGAEWTTS